jgi:hypothetical protein
MIRLINATGRTASRLGLKLPDLRPKALMAAAVQRTGLDDFGPGPFRAGLERLALAAEQEAELNAMGRIMARGQLVNLLAGRLELTEHRKRHPEVTEQKVDRPLFVLGLPRTGTTLLYGLLAQDPAHRSPMSWEVGRPCPPPRPEDFENDPRIAEVEREFDQLRQVAPGWDAIHPMSATLPQECVSITAYDFHSVQFSTTYRIPGYEAWLFEQDLTPSYEFHRAFLQHLQSSCARERWVLKSPGHLWSRTLRRGLAQREAAESSDARFFDVHFQDLLRDPIECVRRVYAHFQLDLGAEAQNQMQAFLAQNPRDKHGRHRYTPEDFGIDRERDSRHFDEYYERFGIRRDT